MPSCNISPFKVQGKILLRRSRSRWKSRVKMNFKVIGLVVADCIHLTQFRSQWRALANTVTNFKFL